MSVEDSLTSSVVDSGDDIRVRKLETLVLVEVVAGVGLLSLAWLTMVLGYAASPEGSLASVIASASSALLFVRAGWLSFSANKLRANIKAG